MFMTEEISVSVVQFKVRCDYPRDFVDLPQNPDLQTLTQASRASTNHC